MLLLLLGATTVVTIDCVRYDASNWYLLGRHPSFIRLQLDCSCRKEQILASVLRT